jgi:predicted small lipoprotein YifL
MTKLKFLAVLVVASATTLAGCNRGGTGYVSPSTKAPLAQFVVTDAAAQ